MGSWHMLLGLLLLTAASAFDWKPGCTTTDMCGNVSIPCPFGIKQVVAENDNLNKVRNINLERHDDN
ncbi:hypothetical protein AAC387_Pa01g2730 [Persea americana]